MQLPYSQFYQPKFCLNGKSVKGLHGYALSYRFSFNGKEKLDEINGAGNDLDFGARVYDARLGRWLSLDPLERSFLSWSPFCGYLDNPIYIVDPTGKGGIVSRVKDEDGKTVALKVSVTIYIYTDLKKTSEEMHGIENEIKNDIECNWNNIETIDPTSGELRNSLALAKKEGYPNLPVQFEVTVITKTRSEVEEMVKGNNLKPQDNIVEIVDDETIFSKFEGNSGVFNLLDQRRTANTWSHEFGHMLNFKNAKYGGMENTAENHSDANSNQMMNNFPFNVAETTRRVTQGDVDGLNGLIKKSDTKYKNKGIGFDIIGTRIQSVFIGSKSNNIIYKNGQE
jgi:RHS repeat-associated protein